MISFASPVALLALLALLPVAGAAAYATARGRAADSALGGNEALRRGRSMSRRHLRTALLLGAVVLIAVAMARPRWGTADMPVTRQGIDVAIALDISRSMTGTDLAPTRAEAAARGIGDLLDHLRGDRVGLVTFAGGAFERSPLTLDLDVVAQLVRRAQGETALVRPGTDVGGALETAMALLDVDDPAATQVIVLVSDGETLEGDIEAALRQAQVREIAIYTVAAATDDGADIPVDGGGGTTLSRLDRETLDHIARETGGELRALRTVAGLAVQFARLGQSEFARGERSAPVERFQWFLAAALVLLLAHALVAEGVRPRPLRLGRIALGATALLTGLLLIACGSEGYRHVSDGNEAYDAGQYEQALTEYRAATDIAPHDPAIAYNLGNALHRLGRFEEATAASQQAAAAAEDGDLLLRATYALGSHAFRRDALEDARDAFVSVLLRDPGDDDARHNLELVLRRLPAMEPETPPAAASPEDGAAAGDANGEANGEANDASGGGGASLPGGEEDAGAATAGRPQAGDVAGGTGPEGAGPGEADAVSREEALAAAQQALLTELEQLGEAATLEEALAILDLVRRANVLELLKPEPSGTGPLPPR